jgi:hypothetical protein
MLLLVSAGVHRPSVDDHQPNVCTGSETDFPPNVRKGGSGPPESTLAEEGCRIAPSSLVYCPDKAV